MTGRGRKMILRVMPVLLVAGTGLAQQDRGSGQLTDSSRIGVDGTAYVTRVVPVPTTISPEAQKMLARVVSDTEAPQKLEELVRRRKNYAR